MQIKKSNQTNETLGSNLTGRERYERDRFARHFDGMGTATARFIINRHLGGDQWEKYGLKELKNTGRYYFARLIEKDGKVIDEVLIDKQTGRIQSLRGKTGVGS